jgi:hypothetical protein
MGWLIGVLAVGIVALGAGYDRKRQWERSRVSRPEINRWEEEGGAVPTVEPAAEPTIPPTTR